jgi:sugar O-acyltransferase (sialic acid O-acetyltransferase NeuD family)
VNARKSVVIVGGRGSGEMAASVFEAANALRPEWTIAGFLNDVMRPGERLGQYRVLGGTEEVLDFVGKDHFIHYTLHCTSKDKRERVERFKKLGIPPQAAATAVHPLACLDPSTRLGRGVLVSPFAATSVGVEIGDFVHAYPHSYMAHDAVVGDFVTLTAHAIVGARVRVGEGAQLGLHSCIREDVHVGRFALVGMGAVVLEDVEDRAVVAGNPARVIGKK